MWATETGRQSLSLRCGLLKLGDTAFLFTDSETREFAVKISYVISKLPVSKGEILRRYLDSRRQIYASDVASFVRRTTGFKTYLFTESSDNFLCSKFNSSPAQLQRLFIHIT